MKKIALCMIVKNESKRIEACLNSVKPLIDHVIIVDTGSTDDTKEIIQKWLDENCVPGLVVDEPWVNFAVNRTRALELCRGIEAMDYALMIDADEVLVYYPGFNAKKLKEEMTHDIYDIEIKYGGLSYFRPHIYSNKIKIEYRGVLHEFAAYTGSNRGVIRDFYNFSTYTDNRGQGVQKFQKDAVLLERALATETDPFMISRYTFYLAQSYRDCGQRHKAIHYYEQRATQGFWEQEIFWSHYQIGLMKQDLDCPVEEVLDSYFKAYEADPTRAEPLFAAIVVLNKKKRHHLAYLLGKKALTLKANPGVLFLMPVIYDYALMDEFVVSAFYSGHYEEAMEICNILLNNDKVPEGELKRIRDNFDNSQKALQQTKGNAQPQVQPNQHKTLKAFAEKAPRTIKTVIDPSIIFSQPTVNKNPLRIG